MAGWWQMSAMHAKKSAPKIALAIGHRVATTSTRFPPVMFHQTSIASVAPPGRAPRCGVGEVCAITQSRLSAAPSVFLRFVIPTFRNLPPTTHP